MKLDMEKTFDRVNLGFLQSVLLKFGFPKDQIKLVMSCLYGKNFSVLFLGVTRGHFASTGGKIGGPPYHHSYLSCHLKFSVGVSPWNT